MTALSVEAAKLKQLQNDLRRHWESLSEQWRDAAADQFEQDVLRPLWEAMDKACRALEEASSVHRRLLDKARRLRDEC